MRRVFLLGMLLTVPFAPLVVVGLTQDCPNNVPHITGTWTTLPYQFPINPVSTTLLRDGRVLLVAGSENDGSNNSSGSESYRAAVWDPAGQTSSSVSVQELYYDTFCSGTAVLPHGRPLVVGGTSDYSFTGDKRASFFDPATNEFAQSQSMKDGRWYATATALGDGRVMAFSGLSSTGGTNATVEIYDLTNAGAGWGSPINSPFSPPLFPREFLLPNGNVFSTGQGAGSSTNDGYMFNPAAKSWSSSAFITTDRSYGSAVLLPLYPPSYTPKVVNFGGHDPALNTTEIIDLSAGSPSWTPGPTMSAYRIHMSATILPNGTVLAEGGSLNSEIADTQGKSADIYDPAGNSISSAGTASYSRLYHSSSLLLPDATVALMGSNPGNRGTYESAVEIYTPRYLYDGSDRPVGANRPAITGVTPGIYGYGASFTVSYTSANPITSAVLVRPGSSTHAFDMEQRLVGLCGPSPQPACSGSAGSLTLATPPNGNIAPPGYYMLFLLDGAGVPSKARFIEISPYATTPPTGTIATPATDVTITAGGTVNFTTTTTATKYSWVFPGGSPATSTAKNPGNVTFSTAGTYTATLTVLDAANNSDPSPPMRTIKVLPASGNFDIDVDPPSYEVHPGGAAVYTVTVTPLSGFTGTVTLAVGSEFGLPAGVTTGGFNPPSISGGGGTSTLRINTTTAAVPYALSLTITGISGAITHTSSTTLLVTLAAPTALAATAGSSQVAVSWQPSAGATGYQVFRSLVSGGPYHIAGCATGTAFTDTGVTNGTTYYYVVSGQFTGGFNSGGTSPYSWEVQATPPCAVPAYSGSLTAARSGVSDTVWSWSAGGAVAYDVVRGDLGTLLSTAGNFGAALDALPVSESACLANDTGAPSLTDSDPPPAPGQGVFVLVRPVTTVCAAAGTYNDVPALLPRSRDPGIAGSTRSCP